LIGILMGAMAYREEFLGGTAGTDRPPGPATAEISANPGHRPVGSFDRPGADVLNEVIPVVFIGRNRDGLWVVRDAAGKFGGLFWRKASALRFAQRSAATTGCATVFPQTRFELDIENAGNPLVARAVSAKRILTRQMRQLSEAIRNTFRF
jgi:hypothetical protein